jgi:hypothetical protein
MLTVHACCTCSRASQQLTDTMGEQSQCSELMCMMCPGRTEALSAWHIQPHLTGWRRTGLGSSLAASLQDKQASRGASTSEERASTRKGGIHKGGDSTCTAIRAVTHCRNEESQLHPNSRQTCWLVLQERVCSNRLEGGCQQ